LFCFFDLCSEVIMSPFLLVACGLVVVQSGDIVKELSFSAAGCKHDDEIMTTYHVLDICEATPEGGGVLYSKTTRDGIRVEEHFHADAKCETTSQGFSARGIIGECVNDATGSQTVSKKLFEPISGPYFLMEAYSAMGCDKSTLMRIKGVHHNGECVNTRDYSMTHVPNYKSGAIEATSYTQKDCAGVPDNEETRLKKKVSSMILTDDCVKHPVDAAKMWMKGEAKDFTDTNTGTNKDSTSDSNNSSSGATANSIHGACGMVLSWIGVTGMISLWLN